jgi:hypothetical protein
MAVGYAKLGYRPVNAPMPKTPSKPHRCNPQERWRPVTLSGPYSKQMISE